MLHIPWFFDFWRPELVLVHFAQLPSVLQGLKTGSYQHQSFGTSWRHTRTFWKRSFLDLFLQLQQIQRRRFTVLFSFWCWICMNSQMCSARLEGLGWTFQDATWIDGFCFSQGWVSPSLRIRKSSCRELWKLWRKIAKAWLWAGHQKHSAQETLN